MNSAAPSLRASVRAGGLVARGLRPLDVEALYAVGLAAGRALGGLDRPLIVGYDGRTHATDLAAALVQGVLAAGRDVVDLGAVTADGLRFGAGAYGSSAIYLGSSSRYAVDLGVQFWGPDGTALDQAEVEVIAETADDSVVRAKAVRAKATDPSTGGPTGVSGRHTSRDLAGEFAAFLTLLCGGPSRSVRKVAVDAVGPAVERVLHALTDSGGAAPVWPVQFVTTGPTADETADSYTELGLLREFIAREGADLAVAFDGDGDQIVLLDERGSLVSPAAVVALLALPPGRLQVTDGGDYRWPEAWGISGLAAMLQLLVCLDSSDRPLSDTVTAYPLKETPVPDLSPETDAATTAPSAAASSVDHGLQPWMRGLLRCPACLGGLQDVVGGQGPELACQNVDCARNYPIVEGIPVLLVDQARVRPQAS